MDPFEQLVFTFAASAGRYFLVAGAFWIVLYKLKITYFEHKKIHLAMPQSSHVEREILYSSSTIAIYTAIGWLIFFAYSKGYTFIYMDISEYGWTYFFVSIGLAIVLHDTYFYWTHRLLHIKKIFHYAHRIHHLSSNPTPWAALSFHPFEALVIAAYVPLLVFVIPMHPIALTVFVLYMTILNVSGHCGFELLSRSFIESKMAKWQNSTTHHAMHHKYVTSNYGLYFNHWDRWMNTNHPDYHKTFSEITNRKAIALDLRKNTANHLKDD